MSWPAASPPMLDAWTQSRQTPFTMAWSFGAADVRGTRIELPRPLVFAFGGVAKTARRENPPKLDVSAGLERIERQCLLVRGPRAVGIALRGPRVAEPHVGVGVEGAELDRLGIGLDRLLDKLAWRTEK